VSVAALIVAFLASALLAPSACSDEAGVSGPGAGGSLAVVASSSASGSSTFASASSAGGAAPTFGCNPVSGEGCDQGETCDVDYGALAFFCYEGDATLGLCASCGPSKGYCAPGSTCYLGACHAFCCDDADCGTGARCDRDVLATFGSGQVGVCRLFDEGAGGAGGSGGAPPAKPPTPDCAASTPRPSQGSCVPTANN